MPAAEEVVRLADLPPAERRIIAVMDRGAQRESEPSPLAGVIAMPSIIGLGWWAYKRMVAAPGPRLAGSADEVLFIPPAAIDERSKFAPGHPSRGLAYVQNPVRPDVYVVMAEFHRIALREKAGELFRLLAGLRAESATIEVVRGRTRGAGGDVDVPLPAEAPVQIDLGARMKSSTREGITYSAKFSGEGPPRLDPELKWIEHEPEWRALAHARLEAGQTDGFTIKLEYSSDFGINAKLKLGLEAVNVGVGGNFEDFSSEEWVIRGRFKKKPIFGW